MIAGRKDIAEAKKRRMKEREDELYKGYGGTDLAGEVVAEEDGDVDDESEEPAERKDGTISGGGGRGGAKKPDYEIMFEKATTIEEINEATRLKREAKIRLAADTVDDDEEESDYKVKDKSEKKKDQARSKVVKVFGEEGIDDRKSNRVVDEVSLFSP